MPEFSQIVSSTLYTTTNLCFLNFISFSFDCEPATFKSRFYLNCRDFRFSECLWILASGTRRRVVWCKGATVSGKCAANLYGVISQNTEMSYFIRLESFRFVKTNRILGCSLFRTLDSGSFLNPTETEDLRIAKFSLHRTAKENCV